MQSPAAEAVRLELERIVSSPGFSGAGRLAPFLRFVVERALSGEPIKESVVGVEVFGRPADYDPRTDPIVRVEARRLRSRLADYYSGPGAGDPVLIDLPKGTYVPVFTNNAEPEPVPRAQNRRWLLPAAAACLTLTIAAVLLIGRLRAPAPDPVVAVLPFVNMSGDASNEYFSDGLTEELIDRLAKIQGLRVVARSSVFQFKNRSGDLRETGRNLNATAIVEGSVRRSGDRLRITAQLVDVADGLHVWSETYERTVSDVFAIQEEIARSIATALSAELRVGFTGETAPPTSNVEAYQLYLQGRHHLNRDALAGLELSADELERAIAADPKFAAAHSSLAIVYGLQGYYKLRDPAEIWPKAKASAERAIALNPNLAAGHAALGFALGMHEWKWAEAEERLRRAVRMDPNFADARTALVVASLLPTGRIPDALAELDRALELDPQSYLANVSAAYTMLCAGRFQEAIPRYKRALAINPSFADIQWDLGMAYALAGNNADALRQFELAGKIRLGGEWRPGPIEYALLGDRAAAYRRMEEWEGFRRMRPIFVAFCYGVLGDAGQAAAWLEKAFESRDPQLVWLKVDPRFAKVRSDARVQRLLQRMGL